MRGTLHLVTARDYPMFWWALRDMPTWYDDTHLAHALDGAEGRARLAEQAPLTHKQGLEYLERRRPHGRHERRRIFHAVRRRAHLLHAPESALWTTQPSADLSSVPGAGADGRARPRAPSSSAATSLPSGPSTRADIAELVGTARRRRRAALDALRAAPALPRRERARAARRPARTAAAARHACAGPLSAEVGQHAARAHRTGAACCRRSCRKR